MSFEGNDGMRKRKENVIALSERGNENVRSDSIGGSTTTSRRLEKKVRKNKIMIVHKVSILFEDKTDWF